jgi:acetyl-CoA carboxylase biotin carboxyl carrier protein
VEIKDINKLIDKITEKGITEFELEHGDVKLRIARRVTEIIHTESMQNMAGMQPAALPAASVSVAAPAPVEDTRNLRVISSPMVGTFYRAPSPGAKAYISLGDRVKKGQVCCIVEAMKIMNEIQSDVEGVLVKVHVENEQPVEYGEPIFTIEVA